MSSRVEQRSERYLRQTLMMVSCSPFASVFMTDFSIRGQVKRRMVPRTTTKILHRWLCLSKSRIWPIYSRSLQRVVQTIMDCSTSRPFCPLKRGHGNFVIRIPTTRRTSFALLNQRSYSKFSFLRYTTAWQTENKTLLRGVFTTIMWTSTPLMLWRAFTSFLLSVASLT